jgi:Zn finger protein HypA/HybF involved in hydrogenase expression
MLKKPKKIFCEKCEQEVESKDGFCPECGSHLFEIKK